MDLKLKYGQKRRKNRSTKGEKEYKRGRKSDRMTKILIKLSEIETESLLKTRT